MEQKAFSTSVSNEDVFKFLRKYGRNTNSFLLAYGGCDWFRCDTPQGLVPYILKGHTCVVAGDPLCAPEDTPAVLKAFSRRVGSQFRIVLILASGWLITQLKQMDYGAIEIGQDPFFDLRDWKPRGNRAKKTRSAVNLARRTGITVSAYRPREGRDIHVEEEMQRCAEAWLASRRGFTLRVFSAVRPLEYAEEKRYFIARHEGRVVGLLTCSPIYARNGWFIEDIMRLPHAPYGTSELLITKALESLREEGFDVATIGLAPFVEWETDAQHPRRTLLIRAMLVVLRRFYNFGGIVHFRKKLSPSRWEKVYLAFWPDRINLGLALDVIDALFPGEAHGVLRDWLTSFIRRPLRQAKAFFRRTALFLHLDINTPLRRRYRFLDSFALGIGLILALVVVLAVYKAFIGPNIVTIAVSEFNGKWGKWPILAIIYVFLAWRLLAMLARGPAIKGDGNRLKTDDVTKE